MQTCTDERMPMPTNARTACCAGGPCCWRCARPPPGRGAAVDVSLHNSSRTGAESVAAKQHLTKPQP
eukprot:scaffold218549_cov19-Tisochrysis_lutea.AAC.1